MRSLDNRRSNACSITPRALPLSLRERTSTTPLIVRTRLATCALSCLLFTQDAVHSLYPTDMGHLVLCNSGPHLGRSIVAARTRVVTQSDVAPWHVFDRWRFTVMRLRRNAPENKLSWST